MNEVDLDRLRHKWNRIQQLSMLNEILRTLATSLKLEESELRARIQEQQDARQLQIRQQALEEQEAMAAAEKAAQEEKAVEEAEAAEAVASDPPAIPVEASAMDVDVEDARPSVSAPVVDIADIAETDE